MGVQQLLLSSAGAWSPLSLSPKIWLDDESSVTNASGYASQWSDRSGNGAHFANGVSGEMPAINATGLNGKRTLVWDGVNDRLLNSNDTVRGYFSSVSAGWLFAVVRRQSASSSVANIFQTRTASGSGRFACYSGANVSGYETAASFVLRRLDADSAATLRSANSYGTDWVMLYFEANWATGVGRIITNGGTPESSSMTSTGSTSAALSGTAVYLGAEGSSTFSDNEMFMVGVGAGTLPDSVSIDRLFGYAAWKGGLVTSLPPGHPYKTSPP